MGLCYGEDVMLIKHKTMHRLLKKYFAGKFREINFDQFEQIFMDLDFRAMDDIDALKVALFYYANRVLNRRKDHCQINFNLLNEVDYINYF